MTFSYDVEIMQKICQKKLEKNPSSNPPGFTRSAIHRFLKFQKKKKLFQTDDFSQQNQKERKKEKNSKIQKVQKDTEMYNKEDCLLFLTFFIFFGFFRFFEFFWIFRNF